MPVGWFVVAESPELEVGQTKAAYYFGRHLVVWRDEDRRGTTCTTHSARTSGRTSVTAASSRATRSSARSMAGASMPRAPTRHPLLRSGSTEGRSSPRTQSLERQRDFVIAWFHPYGEEPTVGGPVRHRLRSATSSPGPTAPTSRGPGRHPGTGRERRRLGPLPLRAPHRRGPRDRGRTSPSGIIARMESSQKFPTPRGVVNGRIDSIADGPGVQHRPLQRHHRHAAGERVDPVDGSSSHTRFNYYVPLHGRRRS